MGVGLTKLQLSIANDSRINREKIWCGWLNHIYILTLLSLARKQTKKSLPVCKYEKCHQPWKPLAKHAREEIRSLPICVIKRACLVPDQ